MKEWELRFGQSAFTSDFDLIVWNIGQKRLYLFVIQNCSRASKIRTFYSSIQFTFTGKAALSLVDMCMFVSQCKAILNTHFHIFLMMWQLLTAIRILAFLWALSGFFSQKILVCTAITTFVQDMLNLYGWLTSVKIKLDKLHHQAQRASHPRPPDFRMELWGNFRGSSPWKFPHNFPAEIQDK